MNDRSAIDRSTTSVPVKFAIAPGSAVTLTRDTDEHLVLNLRIELDPTMLFRMAGWAVATDERETR